MKVSNFETELSQKNFSKNMDELSNFVKNVDFDNNHAGRVIIINDVPAGTFKVPHLLKTVPKYRIILRQSGNAVIYDDQDWTDKYITPVSTATLDKLILYLE